jgi:hypothetical protein
VLGYFHDFAPEKEQWIANYALGKHFEIRMAHAHGSLFALINVAVGLVLLRLPMKEGSANWISWLGLAGLLMPIGITAKILFGIPPILVFVGGISTVLCTGWLALVVWRLTLPSHA